MSVRLPDFEKARLEAFTTLLKSNKIPESRVFPYPEGTFKREITAATSVRNSKEVTIFIGDSKGKIKCVTLDNPLFQDLYQGKLDDEENVGIYMLFFEYNHEKESSSKVTAMAANDLYVAAAFANGDIKVWSLVSYEKPCYQCKGKTKAANITKMVFARRDLLVYCYEDTTEVEIEVGDEDEEKEKEKIRTMLYIEDVGKKKPHSFPKHKAHTSGITCLTTFDKEPASPIVLTSGTGTGSFKVWNLNAEYYVYQMNIHPGENINSLILTTKPSQPDSYYRLISSTNRQVAVWDFQHTNYNTQLGERGQQRDVDETLQKSPFLHYLKETESLLNHEVLKVSHRYFFEKEENKDIVAKMARRFAKAVTSGPSNLLGSLGGILSITGEEKEKNQQEEKKKQEDKKEGEPEKQGGLQKIFLLEHLQIVVCKFHNESPLSIIDLRRQVLLEESPLVMEDSTGKASLAFLTSADSDNFLVSTTFLKNKLSIGTFQLGAADKIEQVAKVRDDENDQVNEISDDQGNKSRDDQGNKIPNHPVNKIPDEPVNEEPDDQVIKIPDDPVIEEPHDQVIKIPDDPVKCLSLIRTSLPEENGGKTIKTMAFFAQNDSIYFCETKLGNYWFTKKPQPQLPQEHQQQGPQENNFELDLKKIQCKKAHEVSISALLVTTMPDNSPLIISAAEDGYLKGWQWKDKEKLVVAFTESLSKAYATCLSIVKGPQNNAHVSANNDAKGIIFAAGLNTGEVIIWKIPIDSKPLEKLVKFTAHDVAEVSAFAITPNGSYAVTGSVDRSICLWDFRPLDSESIEKSKRDQPKTHSPTVTCLSIKAKAHSRTVTCLSITKSSELIVSGSKDSRVKVWTVDPSNKELTLVYELQNIHIGPVTQAMLTVDDYLLTSSWDNSVCLVNLRERKVIHRYTDIHNTGDFPSSIAVTEVTAKYLLSGSYNGEFSLITIDPFYVTDAPACEGTLSKSSQHTNKKNNLLWLTSCYAIVSPEITKELKLPAIFRASAVQDTTPSLESLEFTFHMYFVTKKWNFLNLIAFLLPNVHPKEYIDAAIDNKVYLSLDDKSFTQLHYLLAYKGEHTIDCQNFFAYFFKKLPSLLNLNIVNVRHKMIMEISKLSRLIFTNNSKIYAVHFLNFLSVGAREVISNHEKLPFQGTLAGDPDDDFRSVLVDEVSYLPEDKRKVLVELTDDKDDDPKQTEAQNQKTNTNTPNQLKTEEAKEEKPLLCQAEQDKIDEEKAKAQAKEKEKEKRNAKKETANIEYTVVLLPLTYNLYDKDVHSLITAFRNTFTEEDTLFYENKTVQTIVRFLWNQSIPQLWAVFAFYALQTVIYSCFVAFRYSPDPALILAILALVLAVIALTLETLQASVERGMKEYIKDPRNIIELTSIFSQIISVIFFFIDRNGEPEAAMDTLETVFASISMIFLFTKFLLVLRMIDSLRHLIRMILEIIKDIIAFLFVILIYTLAFTIIMYQDSLAATAEDETAEADSFPVHLLRMFTLAIGSYDTSDFSGAYIAFFIFAALLQPLILLNMLIAIMNDTYQRVQENSNAYECAEKLAMMEELSSVGFQLKRIRKCRFSNDDEEDNLKKKFLITAEKFNLTEEDEMTNTDIYQSLKTTFTKLDQQLQGWFDNEEEYKNHISNQLEKIYHNENHIINKLEKIEKIIGGNKAEAK